MLTPHQEFITQRNGVEILAGFEHVKGGPTLIIFAIIFNKQLWPFKDVAVLKSRRNFHPEKHAVNAANYNAFCGGES